MALPQQAAEIIARLELKPHPEGGHYRETFRDQRTDANERDGIDTGIIYQWGQIHSIRETRGVIHPM